MNKRPLILVTNDDGITAPGIRTLIAVMNEIGDEVVVAPDSPQSGMGHAITLGQHLRLTKVHWEDDPSVEAYSCSGTPVDCVKLAVDKVLHRKPTICLSGINHGANHSINVIYSGTMSAAMEASLEGISSIGFSVTEFQHGVDFKPYTDIVRKITEFVMNDGIEKSNLLNVNIPFVPIDKLKGIKVCRQAEANWKE